MPEITADGYGVTATLTPTELRARGTNKATHLALVGPESPHLENGTLVLPVDLIARVQHARPKMGGLVNGHVVIHLHDGRQYEMHYRAKHNEFQDLAESLVSLVGS
jgi:hypothetical protein